ncbi:MAG: hypothetical protein ACXWXR_11005 [Candidatus Limnocylindrales bacterium]
MAVGEGELVGQTTDGRVVSGHVVIADRQVGPGGRRETLLVFRGSRALAGLDA